MCGLNTVDRRPYGSNVRPRSIGASVNPAPARRGLWIDHDRKFARSGSGQEAPGGGSLAVLSRFLLHSRIGPSPALLPSMKRSPRYTRAFYSVSVRRQTLVRPSEPP